MDTPKRPAAPLDRLRAAHPTLPAEYFEFLAHSDGGEGKLAMEPRWYVVWPAETALVATVEYELPEYLPGYFAFGGNGSGELFVVPLEAHDGRQPIYMVPAIGMAFDTFIPIAGSFAEFVAATSPG